jgi:4-alpha-glucanotransferase
MGPRASGILLHPTSLPGRFGIGDLGPAAYRFVDFLAGAGQRLWQVLPLGPTSYGDSPYQCFSAFAGNPLLLSPDVLRDEGWLDAADLEAAPVFSSSEVDYGAVMRFKSCLLERAAANFEASAGAEARAAFESFQIREAAWLDDFALFMAAKQAHGGALWTEWDADLSARRPEALAHWKAELAGPVRTQQLGQHFFFRQWNALREKSRSLGVAILGDVPLFVSHDSADVWAHRELFRLDSAGQPETVAGVPPDYFSKTGQLWGTPVYRWDVLAETGYRWWVDRLRTLLELVDRVRLDHFRGFEACWEVPAGETTAVRGRWVPGPGAALFEALRDALGELPIVAEDLGLITPEVVALRERFGFPGMAVLQFAFGAGSESQFLPHNHRRDQVVYTGTHDNDTVVGWWQACGPAERRLTLDYLGGDGKEMRWTMIRTALASVAETAVVPLQDVLGLDNRARMNLPGRPGGNWRWRVDAAALDDAVRQRLLELTRLFGRA